MSDRRSSGWHGSPPLSKTSAELAKSKNPDARAVGQAGQRVIKGIERRGSQSWTSHGKDRRK